MEPETEIVLSSFFNGMNCLINHFLRVFTNRLFDWNNISSYEEKKSSDEIIIKSKMYESRRTKEPSRCFPIPKLLLNRLLT